jgi:Ribbon-helix-helix protein, copG family
MRTTVRLDDHLLREVKRIAAQTGKTLTAVIEDALRESLLRHAGRRQRTPVKLPTFKGKGLRPGVDLDDSAGLLEMMEGRRGSG